jgi:hypothetical protein
VRKEGDFMFIQDEKVYRAARAFAMQSSEETIKDILLDSIDFDEDRVEEIMSMIKFQRDNIDGGYAAFIKAVNQVLGNQVYGIECVYEKVKKGQYATYKISTGFYAYIGIKV